MLLIVVFMIVAASVKFAVFDVVFVLLVVVDLLLSWLPPLTLHNDYCRHAK